MKLMVFLLVYIQGKCLKTAENQKGIHWFSICLEFRGRQTCNTEARAPQGGFGRRAVAISEAYIFRSLLHMPEALLSANLSPLLNSVGKWCSPCSKAANRRPQCCHWLHIATGEKGKELQDVRPVLNVVWCYYRG